MEEEQFVISLWEGGDILCVHGALMGTKANSRFTQLNCVLVPCVHRGMLLLLRLSCVSRSEHTEVQLCFSGNRGCARVGINFSHFTRSTVLFVPSNERIHNI